MPSFIIHLCLAKEYARKHPVKNEEEFAQGTIAPDLAEEKAKSHYSYRDSCDTNLYEFLLQEKLNSSFQEGYFLHLLADFAFYNRYFPDHRKFERSVLMNDFDVLTKELVEKYAIKKVPSQARKYMQYVEGTTAEYHYDKVIQFIEDVSNYELHQLAEKILQEKDFKFLLK